MYGHESREEVGMCCQRAHSAIAKLRLITEQQK
jgi:hypothetical protein